MIRSGRLPSVTDIFSQPDIGKKILAELKKWQSPVTIMEVCGTHTVALFKTGIRASLPPSISLVSGPGCPVCVTPGFVIDSAIALARRKNTILFCFGDMLRVPASTGSLESLHGTEDASVKIMYSPMEALVYAQQHPDLTVVLFGVGFETTIPLFASVIARADSLRIRNLRILCAFKLVPPALVALLSDADCRVNGFLLPGHVSAIIGERAYSFVADSYHVPAVITGFESIDMLRGISELLVLIQKRTAIVQNEYTRIVTADGNIKAQELMRRIFKPVDSLWRGLGVIPQSGLTLADSFDRFNAEQLLDTVPQAVDEPKGCLCGEVIKGKKIPKDCGLYKRVCTPEQPVGPCMVSSEGTCAAYYKYAGE